MSDPFAYKAEDAYYGPLGELAKRLTPCIPINVLAFYCQLLVAIGVVVGRRARARYIADEHHANLFLITVGKTGAGKGTSWNVVKTIATKVDSLFPKLARSDSASAPGLIKLVRDASEEQRGRTTVRDPGVKDKRCLVVFEEMDAFVTAVCRQGSTLGELCRQAWDGRTLENNAKDSARATEPHISLICHVTPCSFQDALLKLGKKSLTNGFLNRFLVVPLERVRQIHRSQELPALDDLIERIAAAINQLGAANDSAEPVVLEWSPEAHAEWDAFSEAIDNGHPFLEGMEGVTGRLKPMVMRLAMLYAVLDGETQMSLKHLIPAKALCLQLIEANRSVFTGSSKAGMKSLLSRLSEYRPADATFSLTALHNWLKSGSYSTDELHNAIDEMVSSGDWVAVVRNDSVKHRGWIFALRGQGQATPCPATPMKASEGLPAGEATVAKVEKDSDHRTYDGHRYKCGAAFTVPRMVDGLDMNDQTCGIPAGKQAFLVQAADHPSEEDRQWLDEESLKKPHHRLVSIDDRLIRLPLKPALEWAGSAC